MKIIEYQNFIVEIEKAFKNKYIRLKIKPNGHIHLSLPFLVSQKQGLDFLKQNHAWILQQLKTLVPPKKFMENSTIFLLGQELKIIPMPTAKRGVWQENNSLFVSGLPEFLHRRVKTYIQEQTLKAITAQVMIFTQKLNIPYGTISLRNTSSRWGSCSSNGNLHFCWKIGLAPPFVLEYLVAHEVAHLKEMNHSDAFWRIVCQLTDTKAKASIWLRRNGNDLLAWE